MKLLTQEPANERTLSKGPSSRVIMDPGFDAENDFCADLAYATVLRRPVERVHSHMCERGAKFEIWQERKVGRDRHRLAVNKHLRDNYYVRSFSRSAWDAEEGGINKQHLMEAARTLARYDVVMTVDTINRDSVAQMGRVGLPSYQ